MNRTDGRRRLGELMRPIERRDEGEIAMDRDIGELPGRPPEGENGPALRCALGLRIERLRRLNGMLQQDLATALDLTVGMVTRYEAGHNAPRIEVLVRLRRIFSSTLDHLLLGQRLSGVTDIRLLARLGRMEALPSEHKAGLLRVIDAYLETHEVPRGPAATSRVLKLD